MKVSVAQLSLRTVLTSASPPSTQYVRLGQLCLPACFSLTPIPVIRDRGVLADQSWILRCDVETDA